MKISNFSQKIEGLASMNYLVPICNGGITTLPSFEYENTTNNYVILTPDLTDDTSRFLGQTMFVIPKMYIVKPKETINIALQIFNNYNPNCNIIRKSAFTIEMRVIEFDSNCSAEEAIEFVTSPAINVASNNSVQFMSESKNFIHKYFGDFGKRGRLYKDWVEKGRPVDENNEPILDPELAALNH